MSGKKWQSYHNRAKKFMVKTEKFIHDGVNPGGYYQAVWCRDASYILKDWFLSGLVDRVMQELLFIWSHQIKPGREKIVFGRGSPTMKYLSEVATARTEKRFEGALPTSIFHGYSEVFGKDPDIDSTTLMISTTAWILDCYLQADLISRYSDLFERRSWKSIAPPTRLPAVRTPDVIKFVMPRMLKAVDYLQSRDIDSDGLLEQDHNEDWMDSVLRAGKIVYSQACWILALTNLSVLLSHTKKHSEASRLMRMAERNITSVENELWSDDEGCYIDKQEGHHIGRSYKTLTQDVSLYLVATTEQSFRDALSAQSQSSIVAKKKRLHSRRFTLNQQEMESRATSTLGEIKSRIWKDKWPLVCEAELKRSGPWVLDPNVYHNHTFWPWTTGIEMLARSRYGQFNECASLLSSMMRVDGKGNLLAFYEWVSPVTGKGSGAFPFRTGTSSIRIALTDIITKLESSAVYTEPKDARSHASVA